MCGAFIREGVFIIEGLLSNIFDILGTYDIGVVLVIKWSEISIFVAYLCTPLLDKEGLLEDAYLFSLSKRKLFLTTNIHFM